MRRMLTTLLTISLVTVWLVPAASAQDRAAIEQRLREELGKLLKTDPAKLPLDKPVITLGADDLTVVEWQMAAEKAFRVDIDPDKLFEPKSKTVARKDLTILSMAGAVATGKPWPPGKTK